MHFEYHYHYFHPFIISSNWAAKVRFSCRSNVRAPIIVGEEERGGMKDMGRKTKFNGSAMAQEQCRVIRCLNSCEGCSARPAIAPRPQEADKGAP